MTYHSKQLEHELDRIRDDENDLKIEVTVMDKGLLMDVGDRAYHYEKLDEAQEDAARLVDDLGLDVSKHYLLKTFVLDSLHSFEVFHAPAFEYDPEDFPVVVHSNQSITRLDEHGPFDVHLYRREIAGENYYLYNTHPELGFTKRPYIIKSSEGDDVGPRFEKPQHALSFLDGMEWMATE